MPHVKSARLRSDANQDVTGSLTLDCNDGISCRIQAVTPHIVRVLFTRSTGLRQPRTWAIAPLSISDPLSENASSGKGAPGGASATGAASAQPPGGPAVADCPLEGWDRTAVPTPEGGAFTKVSQGASSVVAQTPHLTLTVSLDPFGLKWASAGAPEGEFLAEDRPSRPYHFAASSHSLSHAMVRREGDVFLGMGDKTGPLNLHGRKLGVAMRDALGYNPRSGDPLYKHWPFLVTRDAASKQSYGILYDNMAEATMDLGCEHSNYYGLYRTYEAQDGDLDFYFILGPEVRDVVQRMVPLIGGTALMPRWSLGFHCTAMPLADHPQAQQAMQGFIEEAQRSSVPCSAFHFGSGYTSIGKRRYVFHWNKTKFPDPQALIRAFHAAGMRVVANVKPCLLTDHPSYPDLAAQGGFIAAPVGGTPGLGPGYAAGGGVGAPGAGDEGEGGIPSSGGAVVALAPAVSQFWDGEGSHVDFTNPAALRWWRDNLQTSLLDLGISTAWNDNNEYEITEEFASSHNFGGAPLPLSVSRPLHCLLMTRASFEQQLLSSPGQRPYSVTRAGFFGVQRYAQTWTGDNATSWDSLAWNLRMGLTLSVSGLFNIGHDVGGFSGPAPEPELLVRWVQAGLLHPRFIMNSWKADGTVTTPWMHPSVLPLTRWAIRLRYRLIPHLYSLLISSSAAHEPFLRPTFWDFPGDERCWEENGEMMLGGSLLAAPVVERGARQRTLYLPGGTGAGAGAGSGAAAGEGAGGGGGRGGGEVAGWFDFFSEEFYAAGQEVTVGAPLGSLPLFARAGAVIPMTASVHRGDFAKLHDEPSRVLRIFPAPLQTSSSSSTFYEDDGISLWAATRSCVAVTVDATPETVTVTVTGAAGAGGGGGEEGGKLPYELLGVALPAADQRQLVLNSPPGGPRLEAQTFLWHSITEP